jgi:peptidyl-prolyl cis-trans isomerase D
VKLDVVSFGLARLEPDIQAADAELQAHFDRNRESYRAPDQRKVKYLLIDAQAQRAGIAIPPRDVERAYNDRIDQYSTPEQVRASHILFKTEGKDEASVRARAEAVLAKARAGADFAQLAREYSEDESNAKLGGDLDYFARGRMVPEFDQAVFAMQPGSTSDLVRTQYGFHIIRLVDKRPASTKPLDAVRAQITEQLLGERAAARASEVAATLATQIDAADDLERVARERGLKVQESGFFAKGDPVLGLGFSPQISTLAFDLEEGAVSPMVPVGQGFAFLAVSATRASYLPKLDEVKDKVRQDVQKLKAGAAARAQAAKALAALRASSDFQKAAKAAGIEVKTTELITRGGAIPDVGVSAAIDAAAFSLPVGSVSDPIETNDHIVIIRVAERQEAAAAEVEKGRESLRQELAAQERSRFFDAYMEKAKARLNIRTYPDVLERAVS